MIRNPIYLLIDLLSITGAFYLSLLLRFEFIIPEEFFSNFLRWTPFLGIVQLFIFYLSGHYSRIHRYTSLFDIYAIFYAIIIANAISIIGLFFTLNLSEFPRTIFFLYITFNIIFTLSSRIVIRIYYSHYHNSFNYSKIEEPKKLLLIGAGKTGEKILREILTTSRHQFSAVGFVDDDPNKHNALLHGKKIFCGLGKIQDLKIRYDEILITAQSLTGDQMRRIVDICKLTGKPFKTVPSLSEIIDKEVSLAGVRDVSYTDLLGREEAVLDMNSIDNFLKGKRILITGAGGSIGSELVKQCLNFSPAEVICLDQSEESIYKLNQYIEKVQYNTMIKTVLASINMKNELRKVFLDNRPQVVFHAAAYKHVPIQELHPWNAVRTNIGGTMNIVNLSDQFRVEKFVLVSTDKAVNPVNVMGATKRTAEKLIQSMNLESKTTFMAVRFGNVLGSSGSAIPTFQKQITDGGPLTITHPEMTRYFMSIQEASQLILQCGAIGENGEIFLLKMGKPIKIVQMAHDLIRLSGLEPEVDIPIVFTGLRPGEKLYEELQYVNEQKVKTDHKKIMILKDEKVVMPLRIIYEKIEEVLMAAEDLDIDKIQVILQKILPTYRPSIIDAISSNKIIKYDPINAEA
tara:strand:+ start:2616 stop:4505 length:1890 start_codon:yes stop_codon:yes gene_type:complete